MQLHNPCQKPVNAENAAATLGDGMTKTYGAKSITGTMYWLYIPPTRLGYTVALTTSNNKVYMVYHMYTYEE